MSIECTERGEALAELRRHYNELLDCVPRHVKALHDEVLATRAINRRLLAELCRFRDSVQAVASGLAHDNTQLTQPLRTARTALQEAVLESDTTSAAVAQMQSLYGLQRRRLEGELRARTANRDMWQTMALALARLLSDEHALRPFQTLQLSSHLWSRLASYFAHLLEDRDSASLAKTREAVREWLRDASALAERYVVAAGADMAAKLLLIVEAMQTLHDDVKGRKAGDVELEIRLLGRAIIELNQFDAQFSTMLEELSDAEDIVAVG